MIWLFLAAPGCSWLPLAVPGCPWLLLAAPGCSQLPLAAPGWPLVASGCSWSALAAPWLIPDCFLVFLNAPGWYVSRTAHETNVRLPAWYRSQHQCAYEHHEAALKKCPRGAVPCVFSVSLTLGKGARQRTASTLDRYGNEPLRQRTASGEDRFGKNAASDEDRDRFVKEPSGQSAAATRGRYGKGPLRQRTA